MKLMQTKHDLVEPHEKPQVVPHSNQSRLASPGREAKLKDLCVCVWRGAVCSTERESILLSFCACTQHRGKAVHIGAVPICEETELAVYIFWRA